MRCDLCSCTVLLQALSVGQTPEGNFPGAPGRRPVPAQWVVAAPWGAAEEVVLGTWFSHPLSGATSQRVRTSGRR